MGREKASICNGSEKRQESVVFEFLNAKISRYKLSGIAEIVSENRNLKVIIDESALQQKELLDGCYVIMSDVIMRAHLAEELHKSYIYVAKVERAISAFKQGHLEFGPVYVRT